MLKVRVLLCATILPLLVAASAWSFAGQSERDSLRGIKALGVAVENTSQSGFDLTETTIKTKVELQLRKAGITVNEAMLGGFLHVVVTPLKVREIGWAVAMTLEFEQWATLERFPSQKLPMTTWKTGGLFFYGGPTRAAEVQQDLLDFVDQFINDFLAANPKTRTH
jgi:hypothetical protein